MTTQKTKFPTVVLLLYLVCTRTETSQRMEVLLGRIGHVGWERD